MLDSLARNEQKGEVLWVMLQSAGTVCSQRRGISSVREALGSCFGCTDVVDNGRDALFGLIGLVIAIYENRSNRHGFYNRSRLHSGTGYASPINYEKIAA